MSDGGKIKCETLLLSRHGDAVFRESPWPKHISISHALMSNPASPYMEVSPDKSSVEFDLDNGRAIYSRVLGDSNGAWVGVLDAASQQEFPCRTDVTDHPEEAVKRTQATENSRQKKRSYPL